MARIPDSRRCILFLIPTLRGGGAERVIVTLLKYLDRSKFRLTLAVVDTRNAVFLDDLPDDVEFIDLGYRRVRYALPKIVRLIWRRKPDVVFSTLGHMNLALAIVRPLLPRRVRYITRETTIPSQDFKAYSFPMIWALLYRIFNNRVDLGVCQSRAMQLDLVDNFSFPEDKTIVIHNPVDEVFIIKRINENAGIDSKELDSISLIAAGRLSPEKGFDLLIEAIALLGDPRVRLEILGEGPLLDPLKQLARSKGLERQIQFAGFKANPYSRFARADGFVLSSHYEGFPNVVLEALTCGTPVIATPALGGVREILDDIPECSVAESISPEALARAISKWIAGARKRVPRSAIQPYTLERIVGQYEEILTR